MKKRTILCLIISLLLINIVKSQRVQIRYEGWDIERFSPLNGLDFPQYFPQENVITISDSIFVSKIFEIINNFEKCDSCETLISTTVQVIYIDEEYGYDIINMMYYSQITPTYMNFGHMELNGKPVIFNPNLQYVIEEIIKYYYLEEYKLIPQKKFISSMTKKL